MIWNNVIWAGLGRHAKKVDCSARGRLHIFISWHEYLQNLVVSDSKVNPAQRAMLSIHVSQNLG